MLLEKLAMGLTNPGIVGSELRGATANAMKSWRAEPGRSLASRNIAANSAKNRIGIAANNPSRNYQQSVQFAKGQAAY